MFLDFVSFLAFLLGEDVRENILDKNFHLNFSVGFLKTAFATN